MKCSNLKADLFRLHVVDDPSCICSKETENCEHFFFHCHLYYTQRLEFLNNIRSICNLNIDTDLLLFGNNILSPDVNYRIFELVEKYIYDSDRFVAN